ncbi:MAG: hypothetical protein K9J81_11890, partial [Desulfohalobiaceae bacterium]|nr:hypothetical protein [Desulfohalobiaceae bacterium]
MHQQARSLSPALSGACLAVLAAFLFSILNVVIRFSEPHLTVWHMMFGRSVFGLVFLLLAARAWRLNILGQKRGILLLL